jgi:1,4-alpha-glucan branching enzyme
MAAALLLAPSPPLLFMGEEFGATTPFLFFCDHGANLAEKVREGRREEFKKFEPFSSPEAQSQIPDPNDLATFLASKLDWNCLERTPHAAWLKTYRELLSVRQHKIVPLLKEIVPRARYQTPGPNAVLASWEFARGGSLELFANFGQEAVPAPYQPKGSPIYVISGEAGLYRGQIPAFSAAWFLNA